MTLALLFGKKYDQTRVGSVFLDATISEGHNYNSRVTSYPVETGGIISDHIINEPETLTITGIVSDTPLNILTSFNRSVDAFNRLVRIHDLRERITVITGIKIYTNMVITSLQVPRNINSGQSLTFVIELQKIFLDNTVQFTTILNNPFARISDQIPRQQVADAQKYPFYELDPQTSLKDQASSGQNAGIQDLLPIKNEYLGNIYTSLNRLSGII